MKKGLEIEIYQDEDSESPREWCNTGTMVCWHRRYTLGDEQPSEPPTEWLEGFLLREGIDVDEDDEGNVSMDDMLELAREHFVFLPLYLYDHSGITMKTTPFSCPWDSGQVGWIYAKKGSEEDLEDLLRSEVSVYDQYLTGDVWGFCLSELDGEIIDGVAGFYGRESLEEAVANAVRDWIF